MFGITVVDHLRLDSEHVAQNYTVHARAAERTVKLVFASRIVIAGLLAVATAMTIAPLLFPGRGYQIAAVIATAVALLSFCVYTVLGFEGRLFAHRSFAHRLWIVSERFRSLLAEIQDGVVDQPTILGRRDELIKDLHAIYEFGFSADQPGHESVRLRTIPDQERAA